MLESKSRQLKLQAAIIRKVALVGRQNADSGHLGGSYSIADILAVLYFDKMRIDPARPDWVDRDRFVLSKGHCTPAVYATLALRGYFPVEKYYNEFRRLEHHMSGHMEMRYVPGVDMSTGSLGQGISAAVGMAMCARVDRKDYRTYCIVGDGEIEEGQVWEAAMCAGHYGLDHFTLIVDNNKLQLDGKTERIMGIEPVGEKFSSLVMMLNPSRMRWRKPLHTGGSLPSLLQIRSRERGFPVLKMTIASTAVILQRKNMNRRTGSWRSRFVNGRVNRWQIK